MKYLKIVILFKITFFLFSCGTLKEGFSNQKKNNSDEFLVEKKTPLVMPPDYKDLPEPRTSQEAPKIKKSSIKSLILKDGNTESDIISDNTDKKLEESLLEKIKKN
tara:strand:+ start:419 stop:736 length:318 start_codon:yes stop_codon:yes gene_type:complete